MIEFYNSFSFILAFMILIIVFEMLFGSKFIESFLLLVLASMCVVNADKLRSVFGGIEKG